MARTILEVVNEALRRVASQPISQTEYDNPTLPTSKVCAEQFPYVYREVLRMYKWSCATKRAILDLYIPDDTGLTEEEIETRDEIDTILYDGKLRYMVPTDMVKVVEMSCDYEREGEFFLCDSDQPVIRYISDTYGPESWDELLTEAIVMRLAWKFALIISNSKELAATYSQEYGMILERARHADGKEKKKSKPGDQKWSDIL